ncbi:Transcription factor 25, partial [Blattella germanica]
MSSRVLRKLQGGKDFVNDLKEEISDPESDLEGSGGAKKKQLNVNRYDLSHSESEVKEDDDHETEAANPPEVTEEPREPSRRKKRKKKKKKPEFKACSSSHRSSEDNLELERNEQEEVTWEPAPTDPNLYTSSKEFVEAHKPLLHINRRNLNPNNELKRKFGLSMSSLGKVQYEHPVKYKMYTFEHNEHYQQIQKKFLDAVESFNPDNIVAIINEHPYHVDSLIQLSDFCKMSEDLQMAAQLIERALYTLFITLFKHLTFVGQRACYRTALELCKLLLSLDPFDDPLGVILCIDFYALRSLKYDWLISAYDEWEPEKNVSQLPNFAFSVAMAHYQLDAEAESEKKHLANDLLQKALIMFPGVLLPLLEKCSVQPDSRLYVCRNYHMWKEYGMLEWLEKNVHTVLDRVDKCDPYVAECEEKRKRRYLKSPWNVLRHIFLSDIKEVTATFTEDIDGPMLSYDPLPPANSTRLYTRPRRPRLYEHSNTFTMFFRSLLPNFNINEPVPAVDGLQLMNDGGGGEAEGA